jgi:hypothetical protein
MLRSCADGPSRAWRAYTGIGDMPAVMDIRAHAALLR